MSDRASTWVLGMLSAGGGTLVGVIVATLWFGAVKVNADEAKKATDDQGPRLTKVETKVETVERDITEIKGYVIELLRRVPPR